jgi:hypothetical protein
MIPPEISLVTLNSISINQPWGYFDWVGVGSPGQLQ